MIFKMGPHMSEETSCYTMILSVSSFLTFQNCWISPLLSILPLLSIIAPSHFQSHHSPTGISSSSCGWCLHCYHWLGERELMKSLFKPQTVDDMMQCPGDGLSCVKVGKEPHGWRPHRLGAQKRVGFPDPKLDFGKCTLHHLTINTSFVKKDILHPKRLGSFDFC